MPLPVSKLPPGLLSFFGIKNGGSFPQWEDSPQYQCSLDLMQWLLADSIDANYNQQSLSLAAVNTQVGSTILTVPQNEVWIVTRASWFTGALGAGQILQFVPIANISIGAGVPDVIGPASNRATTGLSCAAGRWNPGDPLFLKPSWSLGAMPIEIAAGPVAVSVLAEYYRIRL